MQIFECETEIWNRKKIGIVNVLQESDMNLTCLLNSDGIRPFNFARKLVYFATTLYH